MNHDVGACVDRDGARERRSSRDRSDNQCDFEPLSGVSGVSGVESESEGYSGRSRWGETASSVPAYVHHTAATK